MEFGRQILFCLFFYYAFAILDCNSCWGRIRHRSFVIFVWTAKSAPVISATSQSASSKACGVFGLRGEVLFRLRWRWGSFAPQWLAVRWASLHPAGCFRLRLGHWWGQPRCGFRPAESLRRAGKHWGCGAMTGSLLGGDPFAHGTMETSFTIFWTFGPCCEALPPCGRVKWLSSIWARASATAPLAFQGRSLPTSRWPSKQSSSGPGVKKANRGGCKSVQKSSEIFEKEVQSTL